MIINRVWSMPNKFTFKMEPIKELLDRYVYSGNDWIDPFCGNSLLAEHRNDLKDGVDAFEYLTANTFKNIKGVLFDPPYSLEQISRSYKSVGKTHWQKETNNLTGSFPKVKDAIAEILNPGGYCISFGWNSNGIGKTRGFKIVEILLVAHGGGHNDTICVVERKTA